ncbi:Origin recognition complex subunit 3 [Coemansia sp. RSA 2320]|nr:Origin recognition complex subunit 3 [Coemansia sp. RSA 2320]
MTDTYKPMDAFDSMTESTFILKPPAQQQAAAKKTASKSSSIKPISADGGFTRLLQGKESSESMELRRRLFSEMWEPLEKLLVDTEQHVNQMGVSEVCSYVDSSYTRVESVEKGQLDQPFTEMSTAVAFAGVNTGDHSKLFGSLQEQLVTGGHHVALLESQYCTSLACMLKSMLEQILASLEVSQSSKGSGRQAAAGSAKTIAYDMGLLKLWWDEASAGAGASANRVVVILQDFEGFAPMVVDDFVRIATSYCHSVPIVVVLGLATSYESIHQSLSKASISMLNVEKFNLQRSKQCIDAAIRRVLVEATDTLSFGAEAYKSLLDQFLLYNFSITGFVKKLKFAAMDFFYAQPLSVLASMLKRSASGALAVVGCPIRLSPEQLELVRMQKSVQRFLEQQLEETGDSQHFRLALSSDEYMQNSVLPQLLRRLASFRAGYCLGIDLVVALQDVVPESLQKPIRTLHYYAISQRFDDCMHWKALSAVMRRMKAPDMDRLLARINAIVEAAAIPDWDFATKNEVDIPLLLQQTGELLANPEQPANPADAGAAEPAKRVRTRTDMENRPFLLFDNNSSDHMLKALDQCCANIEAILRVCLSPYQSAPLHEVFYYKHSLLLDTTFSAQPRAAVQAALGKTSYYIDCDCCRATSCDSDDSGVSEDAADQRVMPSMQDTSIRKTDHVVRLTWGM